MTERAVLFIDGNNWYHGLRSLGLTDLGRLDYAKVSRKLVGPARAWQATRYCVGQVNQAEAPDQYAAQRRFFSDLAATDPRISHHLGRLETRVVQNDAADELLRMLNSLPVRIDIRVYGDLVALAQKHRRVAIKVEKAVDVQIAVDMVSMAQRNAYDAAYRLPADPRCAARGCGQRVHPGGRGLVQRLLSLTRSISARRRGEDRVSPPLPSLMGSRAHLRAA